MSWDITIAITAGILGLFFVAFGTIRFILGKKLSNLKSIPLNQLHRGLIQVSGKVSTSQPMTAPLTKKKCVFYEGEIREYSKTYSPTGGSKDYEWRTIFSYKESVPFQIDDGRNQVIINPQKAEWEIYRSSLFSIRQTKTIMTRFNKFQVLQEISQESSPKSKSEEQDLSLNAREGEEWTLNLGDRIYVTGYYDGNSIIRKKLLLISEKPCEKYARKFKFQGGGSFIFGLFLLGICFVFII